MKKMEQIRFQKLKIAITIPTGRVNVKNVVKAFIDNAIYYGYNPKNFSVYLSIDTSYQKTNVNDFNLDSDLKAKINKVEYISERKRKILGKELINNLNLNPKIVNLLFMGNGYSKQRNSALLFALKDNNDLAICFDDDEAPYIPVKNENGEINWENLDFFTPHIKELISGADITRGHYSGYLSPVPSDFEKDIPEEIRKKLGEALELGSDVITSNSFFNLMNKIKYLSKKELFDSKRPFSVKEGKHGKHIYAGNMGLNLNSIRSGKIPVFFTPPNARGEDTIFALQLKNVEVREVLSCIFHDPFNIYPEIFNKKFPKKLKNIPVTKDSKERFADALIGWLKYAPILIAITSKNFKEKNKRIREMINKIEEPTLKLAKILKCKKIADSKKILEKYNNNVEKDFKELIESQKVWKNKIISNISNKILVSPITA